MFSKFTKKRVIIGGLILIVLIIIGTKVFGSPARGEMVVVKRGAIVKEVLVAGKTKARSNVDLGFDKGGKVGRVYYDVGDTVTAGSVIAELDMSAEYATLAKEQATLAESKANVGNDSLKLAASIREGYRAGDNAVRNRTDQFFKTPRTNPNFEVKFSDGNFVHYFAVPNELKQDLNNNRKSVEIILNDWQKELVSVNEGSAQTYAVVAAERLTKISDFLNKIAYAVNEFTPGEFQYESTVEGYKATINSARSEVTGALEAVIAGTSGASGVARINQVEASIGAIQAGLQGGKIIAPFTGVITKQDAKVGGIVGANSALVSLISLNDMYVEADVSEVNIGKIALGNEVSVEFDALPDLVYRGELTYIEPAETLIDGVVNYKIRVEMKNASNTPEMLAQIRSGLTSNLKVLSAKVDDTLSLPNFVILERDGKTYVNKVIDGKEAIETEVELGLIGSDGLVEIKSGLGEGDTVEFVK